MLNATIHATIHATINATINAELKAKHRARAVVVSMGLLSLSCCVSGQDERLALSLENNPFVKLPGARAERVDGDLVVSTILDATTDAGAGFEELREGSAYHAWAQSGGDSRHLGAFTPGVPLEAELAGDADQVLISVEEGEPTAPSSTIAVSGAIDGVLGFGALDAVAFSGARATAYVDLGAIDVDYQGLPELPEGYRYELWMTPLGEDGEPAGEPVAAGGLGAGDGAMERFEAEALPEAIDLQVTIEVAGGRGARSPTRCLELVHSHEGHANGGGSGGGSGGGHSH